MPHSMDVPNAPLLRFLHVSDMASVHQKAPAEDKGALTKPVKGYLNSLPEDLRQTIYRIFDGLLTSVKMSKDRDSIHIYSPEKDDVWVKVRRNKRNVDLVIPFDLPFISREVIENKIKFLGAPAPGSRNRYSFSDYEYTDVFVIKTTDVPSPSEEEALRNLLHWFLLEAPLKESVLDRQGADQK